MSNHYAAKAAREEMDWLRRADEYDDWLLKKKQQSFGTIILESDLDLSPEEAYKAYSCRWEIEIVMRYYKSSLDLDETRFHKDYSVTGSEFIDFISSVITMKTLNDLDRVGILKDMTYKQIMSILRRAKKIRTSTCEGWQLIKMNPSEEDLLRKLALLPPREEPPKRKRGRPRKTQY